MSGLPNGKYKTAAGSTVVISGDHSGISTVEFDWLEENACVDCEAAAYPVKQGADWFLEWSCEECGGSMAVLYPDTGN